MENSYSIGQCPICHEYGRLEIVRDTDNDQYLVMCDECLAEWKSPDEALNNVNGHRNHKGSIRSATQSEIKNIGWDRFIVD